MLAVDFPVYWFYKKELSMKLGDKTKVKLKKPPVSEGGERYVHCALLGDGMVGKTCLTLSYTQHLFTDHYTATVFDNYPGETRGGGGGRGGGGVCVCVSRRARVQASEGEKEAETKL